MNTRYGFRIVATGMFCVVSANELAKGNPVNANHADATKLAITMASTGDTGAVDDGSVYRMNTIAEQEMRAFAPAIRKAATEQST